MQQGAISIQEISSSQKTYKNVCLNYKDNL